MADDPEIPADDLLAAKQAQQRLAQLRAAYHRWEEARNRLAHSADSAEQQAAELQEAATGWEEAFLDAAVIWLEARWGYNPPRACPYCGNEEWSVGTPFEVSLESGGALSPHFPVMCSNCGNTVFVNAVLAGLLPEKGE